MKQILTITALLISTQLAFAHGVHPLVANYAKTIEAGYEHALHNAGYSETDFDNLVGVSSTQDNVRKIRVLKYKFTAANCAKDLEVYVKLDGSAYLSNKVVGCTP